MKKTIYLVWLWLLVNACTTSENWNIPPDAMFGHVKPVTIGGYDGDIMEPFLSRDGRFLFFNNSNARRENTNLHYAKFLNDSTFLYVAPLKNVNTDQLDAVASMDTERRFYFTSSRSYAVTFSTLHHGIFEGGAVTDIQLVQGKLSPKKAPFLNMDAEISADGQHLYFTINEMNVIFGRPKTSDIQVAEKQGDTFEILPDSDAIMQRINTDKLEYAPCTSADELELFFTRANLRTGQFKILHARRATLDEPFGLPEVLIGSQGNIVEAPTITPDGQTLYFHAKKNGKFRLFKMDRK